jgi:hypothetical protein
MTTEQPWHAAFPAPRTAEPASLTRDEVLVKLQAGGVGHDFILVDLRRTDYEVRLCSIAVYVVDELLLQVHLCALC